MEGTDMEAKRLTLRKATEEDIDILFEWINGLAAYEKRPKDMTGTKEQLAKWLFEKQVATPLLAENEEGHNIGYAIYYPTFGSFSAKANVHVEDLYIRPEYRHQGYGRVFFTQLVEWIQGEGYTKLEWSCLDWNTPSIEFYQKLGVSQESGRVYFELDPKNR